MGFAGVVRGYPGRLLGSCRPSTRCCARVDGLGGERRDNFRPARRLDTDNHQTLIYHQTLPQGRWNGGTLAGSTLISRTTGRRLVCHVGSGGGTAYDLTSSLAWLSRGMWCAWVQTPRHRPRSLGRPGRWQRLLSAIAHDGDLLLYAVSGSHIMCEDHCLREAIWCRPGLQSPSSNKQPPVNDRVSCGAGVPTLQSSQHLRVKAGQHKTQMAWAGRAPGWHACQQPKSRAVRVSQPLCSVGSAHM